MEQVRRRQSASTGASSNRPASSLPGGAPPVFVSWLPGCIPTACRPIAGPGAMNPSAGAFKASDLTPEIVCLPSSIFLSVCEAPGRRPAGPKRASRRQTQRRVNPRGPQTLNLPPPAEIIHPAEWPERNTRPRHPEPTGVHRQQQPHPIRTKNPLNTPSDQTEHVS